MQKLICSLFIFFESITLYSQKDADTSAPYQKFPIVPLFKLLEPDSVTFFTKADLKKNKAVLLMLFSPACEHCQLETEEILKNIDELKKIQIVLATPMPFGQMKEFYAKYKLEEYKSIKVGQDVQFFLPSFFMAHNFPYMAMYDKKGKLLRTFEGNMKIEDLVSVFK